MSARVFRNSKEQLISEGLKIIAHDKDSRFMHRVALVMLILSGHSLVELSKYCGVTRVTLSKWVSAVDAEGFESLREKDRPGRPQKLTIEQKELIDDWLKEDPGEKGYRIWDGPTLRDLIKNKFDVEISERQCQRLLHELGYSLVRPQPNPCTNPDSQERQDFKKN